MDGNELLGAGFAIMGLYCVVLPQKAKLNVRIGGGAGGGGLSLDWMSDRGMRILGGAFVLLGAAIARGWLFNGMV
jgi:hypothetical protein